LLDDRDVILLEQRGTRYAESALVCPQIEKALQSGWNTRLNGDPNPRDLKRAMATALRELRVQGVDLAGYTTKESAADIADLRRLLEIPSWNLYGVSYSTKLMLIVLRDHPEGIRAVILDSLLPPEANWDEEAPGNILGTLDQVFRAWQDDPQAGAMAAGLKSRFLRLLGEANQHPINLTIKNPVNGTAMTLRLNGAGVMNCVYTGLESVGLRRRLPLILDAACRGEIGALAPLAESYLGSSLGSANGMRYAIWCNEEFPFEQKAKMLAPGGLPPELQGFVQTAIPIQALTSWPKGHPDPRENEPVKSNVPIMVASGEFDPDTPPKWAYQAARFLPKAQVLVFAGMSHVPLFTHPEAGRLMRAFLEDPLRPLDPGKIGIRPPFLLTLDPK
jgi:pimeloyl-ACP methyl ester carboxylesterase